MNSLKDQLLKAGLVSKKDTKPKPKKKAPTKPKKSRNAASETTLRAQRAMLDKAKKDKKLNEQRKIEAQKKQIAAQVKLVESSKLDRSEGEVSYHFTFKKKVKSIYVTEEQQKQLSRDQVVIISLGNEAFELVPKLVANKISERDAKSVIKNDNISKAETSEDDPYADYEIPDDLIW